MAQNPGNKIMDTIAGAYDKLALFVVLLVLLASVVLLVMRVEREKKNLLACADHQSHAPLLQAKASNAEFLPDAIEELNNPFQIGPSVKGLLVTSPRVACRECGRPIPKDADACTFKNCGAAQHKTPPQQARVQDTDFDRMPDAWEIEHGLNPKANDAELDLDGDRWTNLEEYMAGTNPADPLNHPPPVTKLRWVKIQPTLLPYSFQSVSYATPTEALFTLKSRKQDHHVQLGDKLDDGYEVIKFEPKTREVIDRRISPVPQQVDVSVLTLRKGDKTIELTLGQDQQRGELAAELLFLVDQSRHQVRLHDVIKLLNEQYKVVDIKTNFVVVLSLSNRLKSSLEKYEEAVATPEHEKNPKESRPLAVESEQND